MDTNLARRITALVEEIDALDYLIESDDPTKAEAQIKIAENRKALELLIDAGLRQMVIETARQETLESYRR